MREKGVGGAGQRRSTRLPRPVSLSHTALLVSRHHDGLLCDKDKHRRHKWRISPIVNCHTCPLTVNYSKQRQRIRSWQVHPINLQVLAPGIRERPAVRTNKVA